MSSQLDDLKAEIDEKRRFIATLPDWETLKKPQANEKADHIKQLSEKEEEYELLVESKRIESVVCEHEKLHPPLTERCPVCLDDVKIKPVDSMCFFVCPCSNFVCTECIDLLNEKLAKCPLCIADFTKGEEANVLLKAAENGRPSAQQRMASYFLNGVNGFRLDKREALHWFKLAAEQNDPSAMHALGTLYFDGDDVEQSDFEAVEWMTKAANMGWAQAQHMFASWYLRGSAGLPKDLSKAAYYLTLACSHQEESGVHYELGMLFWKGKGGLPKTLILAEHYLGRAAKKGCKWAYYDYALVMLDLFQSQYGTLFFDLPGHSLLPKCLYWIRKAAAFLEKLEKYGQAKCQYCFVSAEEFIEELKRCAKCKGAWYCSRECQVLAWNKGHKTDCVHYA